MPKNGTEAFVSKLPECDIHHYVLGVVGVTATHDVKTKDGRWGYVCDACFKSHGLYYPELGTGKGQRLITKS
jgi:hypothetical protein